MGKIEADKQDSLIPEEVESARAYLASLGFQLDYDQVQKVIKAYLRMKARRDKFGGRR